MIVAPIEVPARRASNLEAVERRASAVRPRLERDREVSRVPRAVQHRGLQVRQPGVEGERVDVRRRDGRVVGEELEHLGEQLRQVARAPPRAEPPPRGRLGEAVAEPCGGEAEHRDHAARGPAGEIAVEEDLLARRVGDHRHQEHLPQPAQDAQVGVVGAGGARGHPERQRDGGPVLLVEDPFVPGAVGDGAQDEAPLGEIVLRARKPVARASVLSLQREPGEAHARRVDPVVVLRVLLDVPGTGPRAVHAVRLGSQPRRDGGPVRVGQRVVEQVVGAREAEQEMADVQVGSAQLGDLAEPPVRPSQIGLQAKLRLRQVTRVAGQLVPERPRADVLTEQARVVVVAGGGGRVGEVLGEGGSEVRGDLAVGPLRRGAERVDVSRLEEEVRVGGAQDEGKGDRRAEQCASPGGGFVRAAEGSLPQGRRGGRSQPSRPSRKSGAARRS